MADEKWITPREAVARISPLVGGDDAAKTLLAGRIKDRALSAGCSYVTEAFDVGHVPFVFVDPTPEIVSKDPKIKVESFKPNFPTVSKSNMGASYVYWESGRPPKFMQLVSLDNLSSDWAGDTRRWNWAEGIFVFRRPPLITRSDSQLRLDPKLRFPTRTVMYGVKFAESDICKLVADFGPTSSASGPARKRTRRQPRKVDWTEINMQLAAFAYVGNLDVYLGAQFEKPGWRTALRDWIASRLDTMGIDCDPTVIDDEISRITEAIEFERSGKYAAQDEALRRKPR